MDISLKIDSATCSKCGKCAKVCPAGIFRQATSGADIELNNINYCIVCGHCADVCATNSVVHSEFPMNKVHKVDFQQLPSAAAVMLLCRTRRSNRAFIKAPVAVEVLDMILEAAHSAPTASNKQQVAFTLITSPEKLAAVSKYTMDYFGSLKKLLSSPLIKPLIKIFMPAIYAMLGRMDIMQKEYAKGSDPILRGATALMLIHTPTDNRFGRDDANLAYQNGSLMAQSLGVSQFYTGFLCVAIRKDKKNKLAQMFGIDGVIHAGMALGMPAFQYPNYVDRQEIKVTKFE